MCQHSLIVEDDRGSREFLLENEVYTIGKGAHFDIPIYSNFVSHTHATLVQKFLEDGRYYYQIIDGDPLGKKSIGGILINGRKLQDYNLQDEDEIVFTSGVKAKYYKQKVQHCEQEQEIDCCFDIELIDPTLIELTDE